MKIEFCCKEIMADMGWRFGCTATKYKPLYDRRADNWIETCPYCGDKIEIMVKEGE